METKLQIVLNMAEFLVYAGVLVFLLVMRKKGAFWTAKLSVKVTGIFAGVKALGSLCVAFLYLAMEQDLFQLPQEQYLEILSWPAGIVDGITGIYLFAIMLLTFIYLGKVKSAGKKG